MLRKVILNLKHFTSWFIKGEKKNPNQTKLQKPVCNESCYFSITIILFNKKRQRTLGPTKSWNSLKTVPKKLASGALSRTLCFLWTLVKDCSGDWCVSPFSGCAPSCGVCIGWIWRSPCGSSCSSETPPGPGAPAPPAAWSDDCSGTDTEHRGHQPQPHALKHISFPSETCSPGLIFFKDLNNDFKDPETSWVPSNTISTTLRNLGAPWGKKTYPSPGFVQVSSKDMVRLHVLLHFGSRNVIDDLEVQTHTAAVLTSGTDKHEQAFRPVRTEKLTKSLIIHLSKGTGWNLKLLLIWQGRFCSHVTHR